MQSQQKRVKWSRGETAEALEERTDTGITMASVEFLENGMPDIYGNISRRPGLKIVESVTNPDTMDSYFRYDPNMQVIPFYINENDYILLCIHGNITPAESMRIKDGKIVYKFDFTDDAIKLSTQFRRDTIREYHPLSYAQQNNYLLIACDAQIWKIKIAWYNDTGAYALTKEPFYFVGGWYAPDGTKTKTVNTTDVPGLNFNHDGGGFKPYIANDTAGIGGEVISSTQFSYVTTNLANTTANMSLIISKIPTGSIIQFPNNGAYMRVEGYSPLNSEIIAWGSILTPVADESASDSVVTIEYGFKSLTPYYRMSYAFPHPTQLLFLEQRLWAGDWAEGTTEASGESYALVIGSQIAKYNDFKNDYNLENEAITLDILTQYKEKILHLVDYNGLKIMTDSYEYAYEGKVVKQSGNGSYRDCKPIVFESLCLYCDSTGNQIKAMQYEFQSNIFNSSTINTMAPHDLVWYPYCLAGYEDKINSTGKYLFLINKDEPNYPRISVCNFVPGNQAMIWNRWKLKTTIESEYRQYNFDNTYVTIHNNNTPMVHSSINLKDGILFMVTLSHASPDNYSGTSNNVVLPAVLDFDAAGDTMGQVFTFNSKNYYVIDSIKNEETVPEFKTVANAPINVYSNGEFALETTTDEYGEIQADISELQNVTIGLSIDATIRSHPIDVGGKTKSIKKRIGKARMSVRDTEPGALTINGKTGYMNPAHDSISFYGVTGMKNEIKYTITNNKGAMFHLESLLMNIEYGTLNS